MDGFPGRCRVLHTVSIRSMSYIGDVVIEASLAANPQEGDWRAVHTFTFDNTPSSQGVTLKGKFAWIRMRYDETLGELDSAIVR